MRSRQIRKWGRIVVSVLLLFCLYGFLFPFPGRLGLTGDLFLQEFIFRSAFRLLLLYLLQTLCLGLMVPWDRSWFSGGGRRKLFAWLSGILLAGFLLLLAVCLAVLLSVPVSDEEGIARYLAKPVMLYGMLAVHEGAARRMPGLFSLVFLLLFLLQGLRFGRDGERAARFPGKERSVPAYYSPALYIVWAACIALCAFFMRFFQESALLLESVSQPFFSMILHLFLYAAALTLLTVPAMYLPWFLFYRTHAPGDRIAVIKTACCVFPIMVISPVLHALYETGVLQWIHSADPSQSSFSVREGAASALLPCAVLILPDLIIFIALCIKQGGFFHEKKDI